MYIVGITACVFFQRLYRGLFKSLTVDDRGEDSHAGKVGVGDRFVQNQASHTERGKRMNTTSQSHNTASTQGSEVSGSASGTC